MKNSLKSRLVIMAILLVSFFAIFMTIRVISGAEAYRELEVSAESNMRGLSQLKAQQWLLKKSELI